MRSGRVREGLSATVWDLCVYVGRVFHMSLFCQTVFKPHASLGVGFSQHAKAYCSTCRQPRVSLIWL